MHPSTYPRGFYADIHGNDRAASPASVQPDRLGDAAGHECPRGDPLRHSADHFRRLPCAAQFRYGDGLESAGSAPKLEAIRRSIEERWCGYRAGCRSAHLRFLSSSQAGRARSWDRPGTVPGQGFLQTDESEEDQGSEISQLIYLSDVERNGDDVSRREHAIVWRPLRANGRAGRARWLRCRSGFQLSDGGHDSIGRFGAGVEHSGPAGHSEYVALGAGRCFPPGGLRNGEETLAVVALHDELQQWREF